MFVHITFLLALLIQQVHPSIANDCKRCVEKGCTFCANSPFNKTDQCICDFSSKDGVFGGCSDYNLASEPLTSDVDCTFDTEGGEEILSVLIIMPTLAICCVVCFRCCCVCDGSKKERLRKEKMYDKIDRNSTTTKTVTITPTSTPDTSLSSLVPSADDISIDAPKRSVVDRVDSETAIPLTAAVLTIKASSLDVDDDVKSVSDEVPIDLEKR